MLGQIHDCLKLWLLEEFGEDKYNAILKESECTDHEHMKILKKYDDATTLGLVIATTKVLNVDLETGLVEYGRYYIKYALGIGYGAMLQSIGQNFRSFFENVDQVHTLLAECYDQFMPPMYRCECLPDGNLNLHYFSFRPQGLYGIAKGCVIGTARYIYNMEVEVTYTEEGHFRVSDTENLRYCCMHIQLPEEQRKEHTVQRQFYEMGQILKGPIKPEDEENPKLTFDLFKSIWPYAIIFDKSFKICVVGDSLTKFCPSIKVGCNMKEVCDIEYPRVPYCFKTWLEYVNVCYILQVKEKDGVVPLRLKGSIIPCDDDKVIFVSSPKVKTIDDLRRYNLYLADLPIYDTTRQYIMLNQVRSAESNISERLEETTASLKVMHENLDKEKARADALLSEMLPKKVADALKLGQKIQPERFEQITLLFSDIPGFTDIAAKVTPIEIVDLLNKLYSLLDQLLENHNVYKVETVGSTYMLVGGCPEKNPNHAEEVANMALDMRDGVGHVKSPVDGKALTLQVGINSGPVVAAVIGEKMPRYCLFGDTVNTSSRMMSHGLPDKIHVSPTAFAHLYESKYVLDERGQMFVKGKGDMVTYFLLGRPGASITPTKVPSPPSTNPFCNPDTTPAAPAPAGGAASGGASTTKNPLPCCK